MKSCKGKVVLVFLILLGGETTVLSQTLTKKFPPSVLPDSPTIPQFEIKTEIPKPMTEPFRTMPPSAPTDLAPGEKTPNLAPSPFWVFLGTLFSGMTLTSTETSKEADLSYSSKRQKGFVIVGSPKYEHFRERENKEALLNFKGNSSPIYGKNQTRNSVGDPSSDDSPPTSPIQPVPLVLKKSYEKLPIAKWKYEFPMFASQISLIEGAVQMQLGSQFIPMNVDVQWIKTKDRSQHEVHITIFDKTSEHLTFDYQLQFEGQTAELKNIEIGTKGIGLGILNFFTQSIHIPKELRSTILYFNAAGKIERLTPTRVEIAAGNPKEPLIIIEKEGDRYVLNPSTEKKISPEQKKIVEGWLQRIVGMTPKPLPQSKTPTIVVVNTPDPEKIKNQSNAEATKEWVEGFQNAVFQLPERYGVTFSPYPDSELQFLRGTMHVLVQQRLRSWPAVQFDVFVTKHQIQGAGEKIKVYLANISSGKKDPNKDLIQELFRRAFIPDNMLTPGMVFLQSGPILFITFKTIYTSVPNGVHGLPGSKEAFVLQEDKSLKNIELKVIQYESGGKDRCNLSLLSYSTYQEANGLNYVIRDYSRESEGTIFIEMEHKGKVPEQTVQMNLKPDYANLLYKKYGFFDFLASLTVSLSPKLRNLTVIAPRSSRVSLDKINIDWTSLERVSKAVEIILEKIKDS